MSEQQSQTGGYGCLKIAGIGCLVVFILAVVGGVIVVMNFKSIASSAVSAAVKAGINESELPAEQKQRVIKQVDRLTTAYKAGEISEEQLGSLMEKLAEGPLFPLGMVYAFESEHITPSDMTEAEKQAAKRSLQRVARGIYEESIDRDELEELLGLITTADGQGDRQMKEQLTRQELDAFLAAAKDKADEAQVPDEPFEVDVATEIEQAVDQALGSASPAPPG